MNDFTTSALPGRIGSHVYVTYKSHTRGGVAKQDNLNEFRSPSEDDEEVFENPWGSSKAEVTRFYDLFSRDPRKTRFYNSKEWRHKDHGLRNRKIRRNPLCEDCEDAGRLTPAKDVHHFEPLHTEEGWRRRLDMTNLRSLCKVCHNRKKREEYAGRNAGQD